MNLRLSNHLTLIFLSLCASSQACARLHDAPISKIQAIKAVAKSVVPGWHEKVSDEGRFRVLFPGEPELAPKKSRMSGWKYISDDTNWFVFFTDYEGAAASDDQHLREAYKGSVATITKGKQLLSQRDVRLNGRLGTEFVIGTSGSVSYMRAFLYQHRMYTLAVDRYHDVGSNATIPAEVQQFFNSFAYWDVD